VTNFIELPVGRDVAAQQLHPVRIDPADGSQDDRLDLRMLTVTLRRRRMLFLAVLSTVLAFAALVTALQTPRYTAVAQVVLNATEERVAPGQNAEPAAPPRQDLADTEVEVIQSRELAQSVAAALRLEQDATFNPLLNGRPSRLNRILHGIGLSSAPVRTVASPDENRRAVVGQLLSGLRVTRVGLTFSLSIQMTATDPEDAQRIANEYARQYTTLYAGRKRASNMDAASFLAGRLEDLRKQAQADTARVQQYRIANNLLSTSGASLTEQEISNFNQQVAAARAQAAEDQARLNTARAQVRNGSKGDDVGEALNSPVVSGLRARRAEVGGRLASLEARHGPLYPDVQKARGELADVDAAIATEIQRVISNLEARARVSNERLASIQGTLGAARGQLASNNRAMVGLDDYQRRAEASQQLYDSYLARYKETRAQEGTERPEARILSLAELPSDPSTPRVALNMALALVLGSGLGLAAAFISEMVFSGLTTALDVESRLNIRCLASIPTVKSVLPGVRSPIQAVIDHPTSGFAEAFRNLGASIDYALEGRRQLLLVTSALPREGKTTLSTCMARLSALNGRNVVLVDVDVRQRGASRIVQGTGGRPGLVQLLRGEATLDDVLVLDQSSGASILPVQAYAGDLGNLLVGAEMNALLDRLRARFDLVLLDGPPILPIADTRTLATKVDAVVMVVRWRSTADHAVRAALRLLPHRRVPVAGVVLSQVDVRKQAKYGYGDGAYYYNQYKHYYA